MYVVSLFLLTHSHLFYRHFYFSFLSPLLFLSIYIAFKFSLLISPISNPAIFSLYLSLFPTFTVPLSNSLVMPLSLSLSLSLSIYLSPSLSFSPPTSLSLYFSPSLSFSPPTSLSLNVYPSNLVSLPLSFSHHFSLTLSRVFLLSLTPTFPAHMFSTPSPGTLFTSSMP